MQFEPALAIVGTLKRRFGEPMTVTGICREAPLSYQPVYEYVRRLGEAEVLSIRKAGQRLLCEPAATASGSLWLAQWSIRELRIVGDASLRELAGAVEGRMGERACPLTAIVALDPGDGGRPELRCTVAGLVDLGPGATVRVVSSEGLTGWLRGPEGLWEVARRVIPLAGHQQLWALALAARDEAAPRPDRPSPAKRRSIFMD